jgi:LCP family protein required for cell wall assembly
MGAEPIQLERAAGKRRGAFWRIALGLVLGVALSIGAIFVAAAVSPVGGSRSAPFTILVLGTDQRPDERGQDPGRTDSLLLVAVNRDGSGASLLSIPRDLWVPIPGYGEGRINSAYRSGELDRPGSGAALAMRTVGDALGIHVDRAVLVDMAGVRDMVDQLGGIDLDVPEAITDATYPTDDYGTMRLTIPAGRQHLGGDLALAYARTRHQDSDFGRMGRQQQVLAAILAKMNGPAGLLHLPGLIGSMQKATRTNLQPGDAALLGRAAVNASRTPVRRLVIGPDLVTPRTGADGAALLEPRPSLRAGVASFLSDGS